MLADGGLIFQTAFCRIGSIWSGCCLNGPSW
uniref:Uncharacterized protein n=1 Tax=Inoviridae sp. ct6Sz5 TaxID=2826758 RepID=A0A8S5MWN6_9VIRU|nr:MAG TPA: hypothetical protein [Inoviridae sp. ct6Sz5]